MTEIPPHPAKWSQSVLDVLGTFTLRGPVLDPFAGVGAARLAAALDLDVVGLEIEPHWAKACPLTVCGDALVPPFQPKTFGAIVTSCTYGNRMADHHNAQEKCRPCEGKGWRYAEGTCSKCGGLGRRFYKRLTYRHQYGQDLHPNNSGAFHWGPKYREFHAAAWAALLPLLDDRPWATFVLNVKDHWKTPKKGEDPVRQEVTAWHVQTVAALGWTVSRFEAVGVPGMKFGENRDVRDDHEWIIAFTRG